MTDPRPFSEWTDYEKRIVCELQFLIGVPDWEERFSGIKAYMDWLAKRKRERAA